MALGGINTSSSVYFGSARCSCISKASVWPEMKNEAKSIHFRLQQRIVDDWKQQFKQFHKKLHNLRRRCTKCTFFSSVYNHTRFISRHLESKKMLKIMNSIPNRNFQKSFQLSGFVVKKGRICCNFLKSNNSRKAVWQLKLRSYFTKSFLSREPAQKYVFLVNFVYWTQKSLKAKSLINSYYMIIHITRIRRS